MKEYKFTSTATSYQALDLTNKSGETLYYYNVRTNTDNEYGEWKNGAWLNLQYTSGLSVFTQDKATCIFTKGVAVNNANTSYSAYFGIDENGNFSPTKITISGADTYTFYAPQ